MPGRFFFIVSFLFPYAALSQFSDSVQYYLRFGSTGVINKTTDGSSYVLNNAVNFSARREKVSVNTNFNWVYGANSNVLTNNDLALHGDIDFLKGTRRLYYWGLVNYDRSYSLRIRYRFQSGVGIAYSIIDSPHLRINISNGILYEKGDLTAAASGRDRYEIPRNSLRLLYRWTLLNRWSIDGTHFYQPSLAGFDDYIIQSFNNFSFKLNSWLSVTAALNYNRVSRTRRENLLITYGLSVGKYF